MAQRRDAQEDAADGQQDDGAAGRQGDGGQDGTTTSPQAVKVTRVAARWAHVRPGGLVSDPVRSMPNRRQDFRAHTELDRIYPARAAGPGSLATGSTFPGSARRREVPAGWVVGIAAPRHPPFEG
jgi:hypothetical protein